MKKILAIFLRDVKSGVRDFLALFILCAPLLFALVLKLLIPGFGDSTMTVAAGPDLPPPLVERLESFSRVERLKDRKAVEERVLRLDDAFGLVADGESYIIVSQGNERMGKMSGLLDFSVNAYANPLLEAPVEVKLSDAGWKLSPIKELGTAFLAILCSVMGGMIIALNLVEEKMEKTLTAMNVAPVSRAQFVAGKGLMGFLLPLLGCFSVLLVMGFPDINYAMAAVTVLSIAIIAVLAGFAIGVVATDPIGAIASMKTLFLPVFGSVFAAMFLAERWQWTLWWSPWYWAYKAMDAVLLKEATWPLVLGHAGIVLACSAAVFLILSPRIRRGLA